MRASRMGASDATAERSCCSPQGDMANPPQGCRSSACGQSSVGTSIRRRRWPDNSGLLEVVMTDNRARNGTLGAILGALIAVTFAVFLLNGGEHVGKKTVKSDADLPPVATGQPR